MDPTVMGPAGSDSPGNILNPPHLSSSTDKFQYKLDVKMWSNRVRSFARAGDTRAKGVAGSLGHALYARMDVTFRKILDSAIASGKLMLDKDDETPMSESDHKQSVNLILDLVAKESAIDRVRRLVKMSQKVYNCRRDDNETFESFADRFYALAQTYLNHCHENSTDYEGQNFAMILLENANLDTSTYNNIVTYLVAHASDDSETPSRAIQISSKRYEKMVADATTITDLCNTMKAGLINEHEGNEQLNSLNVAIDSHSENINVIKQSQSHTDSGRMKFAISLDKAVAALKDIKTESEQKSTKKAIIDFTNTENDSNGKTKKVGAMMSRHHKDDNTRLKSRFENYHRIQRGFRWNNRPNNLNRAYHQRYRESDGEYTTDDNMNQHKPRKHVLERIGRRADDSHRQKKQVRFNQHPKNNDLYAKKRKYHSDDESDGEQDFRM